MSISPLGGDSSSYSSSEEEVKGPSEGTVGEHKVSQKSNNSEENLESVSKSVIGAEGGAGNADKTTAHRVDKGKSEGTKETRHVRGPEGEIYAVVTRRETLDSIVGDVKEILQEAETTTDKGAKQTAKEGLKITLEGIKQDITSCLKSIPGKLQKSLGETKENLGKVSTKLHEDFKGIPGKFQKSLAGTKENLGKVSAKVHEGAKGISKKLENLFAKPLSGTEKDQSLGEAEEDKQKESDTSSLSEITKGKVSSGHRVDKSVQTEKVLFADSIKEEDSSSRRSSFDESVQSDSADEAIILGDTMPTRDIFPLFSEAKQSLESFFQTTRRSLLGDGSLGYELQDIVGEQVSSPSPSLPPADEIPDFLAELEESVKTQGRSARVREAVLNFFTSIKERLMAFLQFLKGLFSRSSGSYDVNPVDEQTPSEEVPVNTSEQESVVGSEEGPTSTIESGRPTPQQESLLQELRERLNLGKQEGT